MSVEGMKLRFQPKGSMCGICAHSERDCRELSFLDMLPVLDSYKDLSGTDPVHVMIVKCSEFERLH